MLREHAKVTRVLHRENRTEVWTAADNLTWYDRFLARPQTTTSLRKDGPRPRPTKLIFEPDEVGLAPKLEVGDQISELLLVVYFGSWLDDTPEPQDLYCEEKQISEPQDWYEEVPYCLLKAPPNGNKSISLVLPKQISNGPSTELRKQKVRDFYNMFGAIDAENLRNIRCDYTADAPVLFLNRMQHQLIMSMHLVGAET